MGRRAVAWGAFVAVLVWCGSAIAADRNSGRTAQDLYLDCASDASVKSLSCVRFLQGIAAMMRVVVLADGGSPRSIGHKEAVGRFGICHAEPITGAQMRQAYVSWAERNRDNWEEEEGIGAWQALQRFWPCS